MNHPTQIMPCGQVFHMQRIDHHTPVQSYLDMFGSWQKNKDYNTVLDIKQKKFKRKKSNKSLYQLSCWYEGKINVMCVMSNDTNQTQKAAMHHLST